MLELKCASYIVFTLFFFCPFSLLPFCGLCQPILHNALEYTALLTFLCGCLAIITA